MAQTSRVLEAAAVLSDVLTSNDIAHAFHGNFLVSLMAGTPQCTEVMCIVEGGTVHPFGRVRQAIEGHQSLSITNSPWTNRLHVSFTDTLPPVVMEILPAGEEGPRHLNESTVGRIRGIPFLTVSEFLRAKIKAWTLRQADHDAQDIAWVIGRYWQSVDINRIPEQDMDRFVEQFPDVAVAWAAIKDRFVS